MSKRFLTGHSVRSAAVILAATLCLLPSCRTLPPEPKIEPLAMYDERSEAFVHAYDELVAAILATPNWKITKPYPHGIVGQCEHALARAEGLRAFVPTRQVSEATIELAKMQILWIADIYHEPRTWHVDPRLTLADSRRYHDDEAAYNRTFDALPWIELYLADGLRSPWIDETVLPRMIADARRVMQVSDESTNYWTTVTVRPYDLKEDQTRVACMLTAYDNRDVVQAPPIEPTPTAEPAPAPAEGAAQ